MGLKEEIDKLIKEERQTLERKDRKLADHRQRKREQFQPLRRILEEMEESLKSPYLRLKVRDSHAILEIGQQKGKSFLPDIRLEVEPESKIEHGEFIDSENFRVEERQYYRNVPDADISDRVFSFDSQQEVADYLMQKVAKEIAFYDHLAAKRTSRNNSSDAD